jgi:hemerythrin-like metal-binding protein
MLETILPVDMSTGVAEMDRLHFDFFEALGELAALPDDEFVLGFRGFVRHAERSFAREEQWMEDTDFAADKSHREQHARVLSALHHVYSRVLAGDIATGRTTVEVLLPQWFAFHISTMDMALAAAMQVSEFPYHIPPTSQPDLCLQ